MEDKTIQLETQLEKFSQYLTFINRAVEQKENFSSTIVDKVISDYRQKMTDLADAIQPDVDSMQELINSMREEAQFIESTRTGSDKQMQELDLLKTIGAITDEEYKKKSSSIRGPMDEIDDKLTMLNTDSSRLEEVLTRWASLASDASSFLVEEAVVEEEPPAPPPAPVYEDEPVIEVLEQDDELELVVEEAPPPPVDLSPSYDTIGVAAVEEEDLDFALEADDFDLSPNEVDSSEPSLGQAFNDSEFDSIDAIDSVDQMSISSGEIRSAILLRDEGTSSEAAFPFNGETYTIGRSQDNDIQIKNDSKVSRHHCKLFRKGSHFYIEDQHSSNGTLVNGELISERRLYGGEELKIGETVFRFRLQ